MEQQNTKIQDKSFGPIVGILIILIIITLGGVYLYDKYILTKTTENDNQTKAYPSFTKDTKVDRMIEQGNYTDIDLIK